MRDLYNDNAYPTDLSQLRKKLTLNGSNYTVFLSGALVVQQEEPVTKSLGDQWKFIVPVLLTNVPDVVAGRSELQSHRC